MDIRVSKSHYNREAHSYFFYLYVTGILVGFTGHFKGFMKTTYTTWINLKELAYGTQLYSYTKYVLKKRKEY